MAKRSTQLLDALDLLAEQHAELDALFERLVDDGGDRKAVFIELADKLAAHTELEEELFYPRVMSDQSSAPLHEALEEHVAIKRILADLLTMDVAAAEFTSRLSALKERVVHHAHEDEEARLFPVLRKAMEPGELIDLGAEMLVMFEGLIASEPRFQVRREATEAALLS